jgi:hypothetical protein
MKGGERLAVSFLGVLPTVRPPRQSGHVQTLPRLRQSRCSCSWMSFIVSFQWPTMENGVATGFSFAPGMWYQFEAMNGSHLSCSAARIVERCSALPLW